jgi:hypothetical protein
MSAAWSGRGLYWQWIRQPMSWSPCNAILAPIYGDLAMEPRGWKPHPVADGPLRAVGFAIIGPPRRTTSEVRASGAVACLFKNADLSDEIDYVQQVVTAPQLGASISR